MSILFPGSNIKPPFYEVSAEATDLLDGVNVAFASLTNPVGGGFPSGARGFNSATAAYNTYAQGSVFYARDTGRLWIVQQATGGKVLVLISELSVNGAATSPSTEIAYVVASAGYGLSSTKSFTTIEAALTAAIASGLPRADIIILPGSYAPPTTSIPSAVAISIVGMTGDPSQVSITSAGTDINLATNASLSLQNLTVVPTVACLITTGAGTNVVSIDNVVLSGSAVSATTTVVSLTSEQSTTTNVVLPATGSSVTMKNSTTTNLTLVAATSVVNSTTSYHAGTITAATVQLNRSTVDGAINATTLQALQSVMNNNLNVTTLDIVNSRVIGTATATGTGRIDHSRVSGATSFGGQLVATQSVLEGQVTFATAAPTTHTLTMCSLSSSTQCATTSANDTVILVRCTARSSSGVAIDGAGTAEIIGGIAGGGRVATASIVDSVSDVQTESKFDLALAANTDLNSAVTGLVDVIYVSPATGIPLLVVTLFSGANVPDGFKVTLINESTSFGFDIAAAAGDTLGPNVTTTLGPYDSRSYVYDRSGAVALIREVV